MGTPQPPRNTAKARRTDPRHHRRWAWASTAVGGGASEASPFRRRCRGAMPRRGAARPYRTLTPAGKAAHPGVCRFLFLFLKSRKFWATGFCAVGSHPPIKKKKGAAVGCWGVFTAGRGIISTVIGCQRFKGGSPATAGKRVQAKMGKISKKEGNGRSDALPSAPPRLPKTLHRRGTSPASRAAGRKGLSAAGGGA